MHLYFSYYYVDSSVSLLGGDVNALIGMPLVLASVGLICSILGILTVRMFSNSSPEMALRYGTIGSAILFIVAAYFAIISWGIGKCMDSSSYRRNWWHCCWTDNRILHRRKASSKELPKEEKLVLLL